MPIGSRLTGIGKSDKLAVKNSGWSYRRPASDQAARAAAAIHLPFTYLRPRRPDAKGTNMGEHAGLIRELQRYFKVLKAFVRANPKHDPFRFTSEVVARIAELAEACELPVPVSYRRKPLGYERIEFRHPFDSGAESFRIDKDFGIEWGTVLYDRMIANARRSFFVFFKHWEAAFDLWLSDDSSLGVPESRSAHNPKLATAVEFIKDRGPVSGKVVAKHINVELPTFRTHYVKKLRGLGVISGRDGSYYDANGIKSRDA